MAKKSSEHWAALIKAAQEIAEEDPESAKQTREVLQKTTQVVKKNQEMKEGKQKS